MLVKQYLGEIIFTVSLAFAYLGGALVGVIALSVGIIGAVTIRALDAHFADAKAEASERLSAELRAMQAQIDKLNDKVERVVLSRRG